MSYTYKEIVGILSESGIGDADVEATLLICRFCNVSRATILADRQKKWESEALDAAIKRRREN